MSTIDPEVTLDEAPETPETPEEELTPEQENERLRAQVAEQGETLTTFKGMLDELKSRPTERIIERERAPEREQGLTQEEREQRNARLAMALATEPDKVLDEVASRSERRAAERIMGEVGDVAADAVIDRFAREKAEENPILAPKVEKIFRKAIDDMGPKVKAALLTVPPERRKELLEKEYRAAAGAYLMPLARPKVKPGVGTDSGGRGAGAMPESRPDADGKFRYTESQKAAMRRSGMDDKKIAANEKAIQMGLA